MYNWYVSTRFFFSFRLWACRILLNKQPSSCQRDLSEPKKNYINIRNISHCENNWYNRHPALLTGSSRITNKIGYDTFIIPEKTIFLCNVHSPWVNCVLVSIDTRFIYLDDCSLSTQGFLLAKKLPEWEMRFQSRSHTASINTTTCIGVHKLQNLHPFNLMNRLGPRIRFICSVLMCLAQREFILY